MNFFCYVCFTFVCLCVDTPVCTGMHVHTYMWKAEVNLGFCSLDALCLDSWDRISHWPGRDLPVCLSSAGNTDVNTDVSHHTQLLLLMWTLEIELRPSCFVWQTFYQPIEPYPSHTHTLIQERQSPRLQRKQAGQATKARAECSVAQAVARSCCLPGMWLPFTQGRGWQFYRSTVRDINAWECQ